MVNERIINSSVRFSDDNGSIMNISRVRTNLNQAAATSLAEGVSFATGRIASAADMTTNRLLTRQN